MEQNLKKLLASVRPRETRDLMADHVQAVLLNTARHTATVQVDKRYAFNAIIGHEHIGNVLRAVKKGFGENYQTVIQLGRNNFTREREKALPHTIHYV